MLKTKRVNGNDYCVVMTKYGPAGKVFSCGMSTCLPAGPSFMAAAREARALAKRLESRYPVGRK